MRTGGRYPCGTCPTLVARSGRPPLDEAHEILLGVVEERHPLFTAGGPEVTGVVSVDSMGFGNEFDTGSEQ